MKEYFLPAIFAAVISFVIFRKAYIRASIAGRIVLLITAFALATPAILISSNYVLLLPYASWFVELRSIPGTEASSGLIGALLGVMFASASLRPYKFNGSILIVCSVVSVMLLSLPFLSHLYNALDYSTLNDQWAKDICLQTSGYTCVPACFATMIRMQGGNITEKQLAQAMGSSMDGTEVWYLKRGLRKFGYEPKIHHCRSVEKAPVPCILSVVATGIPHVVVLLNKDSNGVVIGEPLRGKRRYKWDIFKKYYRPDGMYMTLEGTTTH